MQQIIREMSVEMAERIKKQRNWVKEHFTEESQHKYETIDGKLYLLQGILDGNFINKDETVKLQSLGITFGDALSQKLGLEWVEVEDEYGIDPGLRYKKTSILLFPLTMISKRIENDEQINIKDLFEGICKMVNDVIPSAHKSSVFTHIFNFFGKIKKIVNYG
ncbi:MAG: DUF3806 domain-containing protein [Planctomycetaceae bacterium]|nr:DUF3806 domain-containing protein [Planctomycetaceae bacterium]